MTLAERFTLIIPTYNRPLELSRLLGYLARHAAAFPMLVLDSGTEESQAANSARVANLDLNIRLCSYPSSITPWEKFWRGADEVKTEFCSLCADDDVLMLDALPPLVEFLERHTDFSAAHGWYFSFYNTDHLGITAVAYASPSLDGEDPLLRLRDLFARYEAVTYAVQRTAIMRQALRQIQPMRSLMARELLAGALSVVAGKVARLPLFYYGRALGGSHFYDLWHPIDSLLASPELMAEEYTRYRQILFEAFQTKGDKWYSAAELLKLLDLIYLRYLSEYFPPHLMDYLIHEMLAGTDRKKIMEGVWPRLGPAPTLALRGLRRSALLRKLRDRFAPGLRWHHVSRVMGRTEDRLVTATTMGGQKRQYRLYRDFLSSLAQEGGCPADGMIQGVIRALNAYE